ncbi:hypothetical protein [Arcobacter sp.]
MKGEECTGLTQKGLSRIAFEHRFSDQSHFIREFKDYVILVKL